MAQVDKSARRVTLSIKSLEIAEEQEAVQQYGSADSGASLGDILWVALAGSGDEAPAVDPAPAPAAAEAETPAAVADAPDAPAGDDDLKRLTGVGPAAEKKLHAAGLTTFAQIAALSADEIAKIEDEQSLSGKFEKGDWVNEAKGFAAEG